MPVNWNLLKGVLDVITRSYAAGIPVTGSVCLVMTLVHIQAFRAFLSLEPFFAAHRGILTAALLLFAALAASQIFSALIGLFRKKRLQAEQIRELLLLPEAERAILRAFAASGQDALWFPWEDANVVSLISKGILTVISDRLRYTTPPGAALPFEKQLCALCALSRPCRPAVMASKITHPCPTSGRPRL